MDLRKRVDNYSKKLIKHIVEGRRERRKPGTYQKNQIKRKLHTMSYRKVNKNN